MTGPTPVPMPVCDCCYNKNKQLAKTLQLLWNIQGYKKDAKKAKHKNCMEMWEAIEKNARKNANILKYGIEKHVKKGRLC